jgi:hypothetical protein
MLLALVANLRLALERDLALTEFAPQRRAALMFVAASSGAKKVRAVSSRGSASSIPMAEKLPGSGGTITRGIFSARASSVPCSGPPPP